MVTSGLGVTRTAGALGISSNAEREGEDTFDVVERALCHIKRVQVFILVVVVQLERHGLIKLPVVQPPKRFTGVRVMCIITTKIGGQTLAWELSGSHRQNCDFNDEFTAQHNPNRNHSTASKPLSTHQPTPEATGIGHSVGTHYAMQRGAGLFVDMFVVAVELLPGSMQDSPIQKWSILGEQLSAWVRTRDRSGLGRDQTVQLEIPAEVRGKATETATCTARAAMSKMDPKGGQLYSIQADPVE